jgi:hypothetical protein
MSAFAVASSWDDRRRRPTLEDRVVARMLGRSLDRELAAGVSARASGAHEARAKQLTSVRARRAVASRLDRLIEHAEDPPARFRIASCPCGDQVEQAQDMIRATADRLRSAEPLEAPGIARLKTLLSDSAGPCYAPVPAGALTIALHDIAKSLEPALSSAIDRPPVG